MSAEFRTDFGSHNEPEHVSRYGARISERVALELLANGFDGFEQNPANIVFQIHDGLTLTYWRDGEYGDAWNLKRRLERPVSRLDF